MTALSAAVGRGKWNPKAAKPASARTDYGLRNLVGIGRLTDPKATPRLRVAQAPYRAPRRRRQPEAKLQRAVIKHLAWRAPKDAFFFHVANGGWRSRVEAAILNGLGVTPGVPDILIVHRGQLLPSN